jgi:putative Ca2+/H+ antiporter (TMEM165/GDT1 family)
LPKTKERLASTYLLILLAWRKRFFKLGKTFDCALGLGWGCARSIVLHASLGKFCMEALLVSTGVVALAEMGDKTQLLAFLLAARFKKPLPIILGILAATIINHGMAGALGAWIGTAVSPEIMRWVLGLSFIGMAIWTLIPDKIDDTESKAATKWGVFGATFVSFFLAEMGDKTQIATVAMAVHYTQPLLVVIGTTLGMLIADVPAVFVGDKLAAKIPMRLVHGIAAAIFAALGVATLLGVGKGWGF